ncbi:zinc knuckle-domain-containing protein [Cladorrhinum sp. PSN259]|nr:zinc knuckle-domain-containing protein [Cladorrhinum sp. PSN259]
MYRGRSGPSKAPANVQCQKCLERGHYSYQCKASTQERPYIARPSRTQQLFNPKLLPKLTNAVPDDLQNKKGVADQELAKREAERARKRELEKRYDDDGDEEDGAMKDVPPPRRDREPSYDSVSSISTRSSRSPAPIREGGEQSYGSDRQYSRGPSKSPIRNSHDRKSAPRRSLSSRRSQSPQERSHDRYRDRESHRSPLRRRSPPPREDPKHIRQRDGRRSSPHRHSASSRQEHGYGRERESRRSESPRRSRSPPRRHSPTSPQNREYGREREDQPAESARASHSRRSYSMSRSRSPIRSPVRRGNERGDRGREYRQRDPPPVQPQQRRPPARERSLSPFSKRLALTQAMNMGGR